MLVSVSAYGKVMFAVAILLVTTSVLILLHPRTRSRLSECHIAWDRAGIPTSLPRATTSSTSPISRLCANVLVLLPWWIAVSHLTEGPSDLVSGGGIFCRGHGVDGLVGGRLWSGVRERGRVVAWWIFDGFDVHADFFAVPAAFSCRGVPARWREFRIPEATKERGIHRLR